MNNRQTLSQPNVHGLSYALLEQKGEENFYRLTGRKGFQGELVKILGTAAEINAYAGDALVSQDIPNMPIKSNHNNKEIKRPINIEQRAIVAARGLWEVFLQQKKISPLKREINIYATKEGKAVISELLLGADGRDAQKLLGDSLKKALLMYGLGFTRPSYDYLVDPVNYPGGWLKMKRSGKDMERDTEIEERVNQCAKALSDIFIEKKKTLPLRTEFDIFSYPEGKTAIAALLLDASYDDARVLLGTPLHKALSDYGFSFTMPSSDYLIDPKNYSGGRFKIREIQNTSIAA